jgi:hypothetical protein
MMTAFVVIFFIAVLVWARANAHIVQSGAEYPLGGSFYKTRTAGGRWLPPWCRGDMDLLGSLTTSPRRDDRWSHPR